jgi:hypothetical protein
LAIFKRPAEPRRCLACEFDEKYCRKVQSALGDRTEKSALRDNAHGKLFRVFYCMVAEALLATARAKLGTT